ncbi:MAG: nucleotide exchange factor GrpE [Puniceicoccaceae bacterium]
MSEKEDKTPDILEDAPEAEPLSEASSESTEDGPENPAPAEAPSISAEELSGLLQKLEEATGEINIQKERYLRTVADLENYRKRAVREKEEARKQAACSLLEDLLPILDHFQLGLKSAEEHEGGKAFAEGFRMILKQMEAALKQNGLEEINPQGEAFDPNFHESIAHLPHETVEDGHVIEVHRVGYRLNERLLRPAQVVVSSGAPAEEAKEDA